MSDIIQWRLLTEGETIPPDAEILKHGLEYVSVQRLRFPDRVIGQGWSPLFYPVRVPVQDTTEKARQS